jgi:mannose-6-phosphate isomerase
VILAQFAPTEAERQTLKAEAQKAADGLAKYLQHPVEGAWWDKMQPDGGFVDEPAPASSLYHIACAILDAKDRGCPV